MPTFANRSLNSRAVGIFSGQRRISGAGLLGVALGLFWLGAGGAFASTVTFDFSGVFTSALISNAGVANPGTFSGTLSVSTDTPGSAAARGATRLYSPSAGMALLSITTDYGMFSLSAPAIQVLSDQYTWKLVTDTANYGSNNVLLDGSPSGPGFIILQLGGGWLNGNSYAYAPGYNGIAPDLTSGLMANLAVLSFVQITWADGAYGNDLTGKLASLSQAGAPSPVPVPATRPVAASGVVLLLLFGRRRRDKVLS